MTNESKVIEEDEFEDVESPAQIDIKMGSRSVALEQVDQRQQMKGEREAMRQRDEGASKETGGDSASRGFLAIPSLAGAAKTTSMPMQGGSQGLGRLAAHRKFGSSSCHSVDQFENIEVTSQSERDVGHGSSNVLPGAQIDSSSNKQQSLTYKNSGNGEEAVRRGGSEEDSSEDGDEYADVLPPSNGFFPPTDAVFPTGGMGSEMAEGMAALAHMDSLPLMKSGYSLEQDMKFGWKPTVKGKVLPIPLVFDAEDDYFDLEHFIDGSRKDVYPVIFKGWRPADSLKMYKKIRRIANPYHGSQFPFFEPSELPPAVQKILDQQMQQTVLGGTRAKKEKTGPQFEGMNPEIIDRCENGEILSFDSMFESGNLDRVVMVSPHEYDLYMRPDTNTRGHHQWFYFKVTTKSNLGAVKFNIINFTKPRSLYEYGMKVCICSVKDKEGELARRKAKGLPESPLDADTAGWKRGGTDIKYEQSKLNKIIQTHLNPGGTQSNYFQQDYRTPTFYQTSFTHSFNYMDEDDTYFAYSYPYTFTRLSHLMKELKANPEIKKYTNDATPLCSSLAGVDVPYLIVTSRVHEEGYKLIDKSEHAANYHPVQQMKKTVVLTGRVHPGEANASYMMEGFIRFITSPTNPMAQELRKRLVFKIVPCTNPDGVIAGNYRVSLSGNDLNRRYQSPHPKLHPIVCAVKKLIEAEKPDLQVQDENQILAFIDMHGHSRKKNVFMYGPEFPIHDARYLKMRVIPKLMSEKSEMFRFFSCKFRSQRSKEKTARVVLWREFNIMSCFTLEASFQGYFDHERQTRDFLHHHFFRIGEILASTLFEFVVMKEEDERVARARREEAKKAKQKLKSSQIKKRAEIIEKRNEVNASKAIMSPSASSEAIANIDDQQPNQSSHKTKMHHLRKKLMNTNQKNKQVSSISSGQFKSISGQKKKFKLTKKFKDDVPSKPRAGGQEKNPNEPPEETEDGGDEEEENEEMGAGLVVDDLTEDIGQRDSLDEDSEDDDDEIPTTDAAGANNNSFLDKFRLKKRTLQDMCHQIKTEEQRDEDEEEEDIGEINSSEGGGVKPIDADLDDEEASDAYRSDDDMNEMLLEQIQGKILGVLKCEASAQRAESRPAQKPAAQDSQSSKKVIPKKGSSQSQQNILQQKIIGPPIGDKSQKQNSQLSNSKQMAVGPPLAQPIYGPILDKNNLSKAKKQKKNPRIAEVRKDRLRQPVAKPPSEVAVGGAGQGQLLVMKNNNFNDRIMTQPYNKYKKNMYSASGGYHPQSLSANTHQLFHRQFLHQQTQKQQQPRPPRQSHEERPQAFSFYNFHGSNYHHQQQQQQSQQSQQQQRPNKAQIPLIQRMQDHNQKTYNDMRNSRGRAYGQEEPRQTHDQYDQIEEGSASSHQGQRLVPFGGGRSAATEVHLHSQIPQFDQQAAQKHYEPSSATQPCTRQPTHTLQLLRNEPYSTPQQPAPTKFEPQNNKYASTGQYKQLPRAQRSAQFSQGQLQVPTGDGFQRRSRRLVPAVDQQQPQHSASTGHAMTAGFQHVVSQPPSGFEHLDKIPHHVPGIRSGGGLCHDAPGHEGGIRAGARPRPGDSSSALGGGGPPNIAAYDRANPMQPRVLGLPLAKSAQIASYGNAWSAAHVPAVGELVQAEVMNATHLAEAASGIRSTTSFTAQQHARNVALETFGPPVPRPLAMSSSMGQTRAEDAVAGRVQDRAQLGQAEAGQGNGLGRNHQLDYPGHHEADGHVYGDQAQVYPMVQGRRPGLSTNQLRPAPTFAALGATMTGTSPAKDAKMHSRASQLGRAPASRPIAVHGVAAGVEGPRGYISGQGQRRRLSGRVDTAESQGPSRDYAQPNPSQAMGGHNNGGQAVMYFTDSGLHQSRVKQLRQIDLNDTGLDASQASLTGPQLQISSGDATAASGLKSVPAPDRGSIGGASHKQGPRRPQAFQAQPASASSRRQGVPGAQSQSSKTTKPNQKGRTIDIHVQNASSRRLPAPSHPPQYGHLVPIDAYANRPGGNTQQQINSGGAQASRPQTPGGAPSESRPANQVGKKPQNAFRQKH